MERMKNKNAYRKTKLVRIAVLNIHIISFYAGLKFNIMKNLLTMIAVLIAVAFMIDANAQKEEVKVIKQVVKHEDGSVQVSVDTVDIDIDMEVKNGMKIIRINDDTIITHLHEGGDNLVWMDDKGKNKRVKIKKMQGDHENMDVIIEHTIGEQGDSIEKEIQVFVHKIPKGKNHADFFGNQAMVPPPPPVPNIHYKSLHKNADPLQQLLDDPEYEIVKFKKSEKKGVEKIEIERKKK